MGLGFWWVANKIFYSKYAFFALPQKHVQLRGTSLYGQIVVWWYRSVLGLNTVLLVY